MTSNLLSSFKLHDVQALHDLMMMKVTEGLAVDLEAGWLAPRGHDLVVRLILGNGHILEHQVADGIQLFCALTLDLFELLLSKFNFLLDSVGLCLLLLALVLSLGLLHLLGNSLRDDAELLSQVVNIVSHYSTRLG